MCNDHPRTSVEQIGICGARTAALASCHRMRADITRGFLETSFALQAAQHIGDNRVLHGGNIGDDRIGETQQRFDDHTVRDIRRRRDDNDGRRLIRRRIRATLAGVHPGLGENVAERLPGAHVGGQAERSGRGVFEIDAHSPGPQREALLEEARWMVEELRVSLFAQTLGTSRKVSLQRITKLCAQIA